MSKRFKFNTRWDGNELKCACLLGNAACDRFKKCEVLELTLDPYLDLEKCMNERSYKKEKGVVRQVRNE